MQDTLRYIKDSLKGYYDENEANSIGRHIMQNITGLSWATIFTDKSKQITTEQRISIEKIIKRLQNFEPIQYVLGHTEFYGLQFEVAKGVLIPRPETEELVDLIIKEHEQETLSILDIGTGSGCIAVSLAKCIKKAKVEAWDISEEALQIASKNSEKNGTSIKFNLIDVMENTTLEQKFDIIVSNPPYVLDSEKELMEQHVLDYEPHIALFVPDNKALMFYERIADLARQLLTDNGCLYFEINRAKGKETIQMLGSKGFSEIELIQDISGNDRIVKAKYRK